MTVSLLLDFEDDSDDVGLTMVRGISLSLDPRGHGSRSFSQNRRRMRFLKMSSVSYLMKKRHGMQTEVSRPRLTEIVLIQSGIPHRRG